MPESIDEALEIMLTLDTSDEMKWAMLAFVLKEMCLALGIDIHLRRDSRRPCPVHARASRGGVERWTGLESTFASGLCNWASGHSEKPGG